MVQDLLYSKKAHIEKSLYTRLFNTRGIAAYVTINDGIEEETFYRLADELIMNDSVISSMSVSKDCILNAIYPLEGHESALGLNLLDHPERKEIVEITIQTRKIFVAGPVELVEGGVAFISYIPIYPTRADGSTYFWGVTDIVLLKDKLIKEIGLKEEENQFKYAIRGGDGKGLEGETFWGDDNVFNNNPVTAKISLPTGSWIIASTPVDGWRSYLNQYDLLKYILFLAALIISILIGLLTRAIIKIRSHEKDLNALFGSLDDLVMELSDKGVYKKIAPTNDKLLIRPKEELIGKSIRDVFSKKDADLFMNAITECIKTKKRVVLNYSLKINDKVLWFHARSTYLSPNSVVFIAMDDTERIMDKEKLLESEEKLSQLNATKDKLFSIIAHDLRSPFSGSIGLTELLINDYHSLTNEEILEYIIQINSSLKGQFRLLENLLNWSRIKTGKMSFEKVDLNLKSIIEETSEVLYQNASLKKISIQNNIDDELKISVDEAMLRSIIHNLISNGLKFTNKGGKINIESEIIEGFVQITVSDNGTGIASDRIEKLFTINSNNGRLGTDGESGTGLGLVLIKEMIEKHGGKIWVESKLGAELLSKMLFQLIKYLYIL